MLQALRLAGARLVEESTSNTVIILRGLPGSGKSAFVRRIAEAEERRGDASDGGE